ncbi:MAG: FecR domain-containing protein [Breznakibacter sp.]
MDQLHFDTLLAKALGGSLDNNEKVEFERLMSDFPRLKEQYAKELLVWEKSRAIKLFHRIESFKKCDFDKVKACIKSHKPSSTPVRRLFAFRMAAASVTLFLLASSYYALYNYVPGFGKWDAVTARNSIEVVELPDNSMVSLNKDSRIVYQHGTNASQRLVKLSGEAFFDVQRNPHKPFVVKSGETEVRVLGTSFNVKARDERIEVSVTSGKVSFGNGSTEITLQANEKGIYDNGEFTKEVIISANDIVWKTGEIVFTNNTLEEVAKTLNDSFGEIKAVQIKSSDSKTRITTKFQTQSLPAIFEELSVHFNKKFTLHEGTLVISD